MAEKFISLHLLQSQSDGTEKAKYYKPLTAEEKAEKESLHTANCMNIADFKDQLKEVKKTFTNQIKPLEEENSILLSEIRTGYVQLEGTLYKIVDRELRMTYFYDSKGELIETKTRPCNTEELQYTIKHLSITGTNN